MFSADRKVTVAESLAGGVDGTVAVTCVPPNVPLLSVTLHVPAALVLHIELSREPGPESIANVTGAPSAPTPPCSTVAVSVDDVAPGRSTVAGVASSVSVAGLPATKALK